MLDGFFDGPNFWHGDILKFLSDLRPEALWRPSPQRRCIWEIVRHMIFWRRWVLAEIRGDPRPDTRQGNWSPIPQPADAAAWAAEIDSLKLVHAELVAAVRSLDPARLLSAEGELSPYMLIGGLPAHDSYHAGQIAYIQALQGFKPIE